MELSLFNIAAVAVSLAAGFGYMNHRWLGMPASIGMVVIALAVSMAVIGFDALFPTWGIQDTVRGALARIDFHEALMKGMLSFLLFAGALHVDLDDLKKRKYAIATMASFGVVLSMFLIGYTLYFISGMVGLNISLAYCLVFGALISPTDPIAVLGILKTVKVPRPLEAKIAGESLFNDGVGVVAFTIMVALATGDGGHGSSGGMDGLAIASIFIIEAFGGAALGLAAGYVVYRAMRSIDDYNLEVLMTLALVMLTYGVAFSIHVSGPIAMVAAGLLIGNHGTRFAMSKTTRDHVEKFWGLLDEILNAVLFLLIGFEVIALTLTGPTLWAMVLTIPVALVARFISVGTPIIILGKWREYTKGAIPVLTWGGLRGGISVALALSLPDVPAKEPILAITYGVVIFSIVVQGLSVKKLVQLVVKD